MRLAGIVSLGLIVSACAQTPPVSLTYPLARTSLHARVVRTVACDATNMPVIANTVTTEVLHSADPTQLRTLNLGDIDGAWANSDLKTELHADGRLKGVNATTTGQGDAIVKAGIKLAELALDSPPAPDVVAKCKEFRTSYGDKPLTMIFDIYDPLERLDLKPIPAEAASAEHFKAYNLIAGDTCLRFADLQSLKPLSYEGGTNRGYVEVSAKQPARVPVAVTFGPAGNCAAGVLWSATIPVAHRGTDYKIPIPKAAFFGKQGFGAKFDESGALTEIGYSKESGGASMLGVVQSAGEALQTTNAERLVSIKSEADIIATQQRLIRCQVTPATCS